MLQLRPEVNRDLAFIEAVYHCTRLAELNLTNWTEQQKTAFTQMQSVAQLHEYKKKFPGALMQVVIFNKQNAGRFYTWESDAEIRLIDITLLPEYRGKGIGTKLLKDLIKRGKKIQKKISLHVDPATPALHLYLRLGFIHVNNNGRHYYMEKYPG